MEILSLKFKSGELFIPKVLLSFRAVSEGLKELELYLSVDQKKMAISNLKFPKFRTQIILYAI